MTERGLEVPTSFIMALEHIIRGNIRKNRLEGIHYFDRQIMKILTIVRNEDFRNIWMADIEVFDQTKKQWFIKKSTTFFPKQWSISKLFNECYFAIKHMRKVPNYEYKFASYTFSGIPVEIISIDGKISTIYPVMSK